MSEQRVGGHIVSVMLPPREEQPPGFRGVSVSPGYSVMKSRGWALRDTLKESIVPIKEEDYVRRFSHMQVLGQGTNGRVVLTKDLESGETICHKTANMAKPRAVAGLFHELLISLYLDKVADHRLLTRARARRIYRVIYEGGAKHFYCLEQDAVEGKVFIRGEDAYAPKRIVRSEDVGWDPANIWHQLLCLATSIKELVRCKVLHADLHAGNMIINSRVVDGRLYYQDIILLDFGQAVPLEKAYAECIPAMEFLHQLSDQDSTIQYGELIEYLGSFKVGPMFDVSAMDEIIAQWAPQIPAAYGNLMHAMFKEMHEMTLRHETPLAVMQMVVDTLFSWFDRETQFPDIRRVEQMRFDVRMLSKNQTLLVSGAPASPVPLMPQYEGLKEWATAWAQKNATLVGAGGYKRDRSSDSSSSSLYDAPLRKRMTQESSPSPPSSFSSVFSEISSEPGSASSTSSSFSDRFSNYLQQQTDASLKLVDEIMANVITMTPDEFSTVYTSEKYLASGQMGSVSLYDKTSPSGSFSRVCLKTYKLKEQYQMVCELFFAKYIEQNVFNPERLTTVPARQIVKVDEDYYLELDFVPSVEAYQFFRNRVAMAGLTEAERWYLVLNHLTTINELWKVHVFHNDAHTRNILITPETDPEGRVSGRCYRTAKLIDFGLAFMDETGMNRSRAALDQLDIKLKDIIGEDVASAGLEEKLFYDDDKNELEDTDHLFSFIARLAPFPFDMTRHLKDEEIDSEKVRDERPDATEGSIDRELRDLLFVRKPNKVVSYITKWLKVHGRNYSEEMNERFHFWLDLLRKWERITTTSAARQCMAETLELAKGEFFRYHDPRVPFRLENWNFNNPLPLHPSTITMVAGKPFNRDEYESGMQGWAQNWANRSHLVAAGKRKNEEEEEEQQPAKRPTLPPADSRAEELLNLVKGCIIHTTPEQFAKRYVDKRVLGSGNYGEVSTFIDDETKQRVCFKTAHQGHAAGLFHELMVALYLEMFTNPAYASFPKSLRKMYVMPPDEEYDWFTYWLEIEFVKGRTLLDATMDPQFTLQADAFWYMCLSLIMTDAEFLKHGIEHRDLYERNVMVTKGEALDPRASPKPSEILPYTKVIDFGFANLSGKALVVCKPTIEYFNGLGQQLRDVQLDYPKHWIGVHGGSVQRARDVAVVQSTCRAMLVKTRNRAEMTANWDRTMNMIFLNLRDLSAGLVMVRAVGAALTAFKAASGYTDLTYDQLDWRVPRPRKQQTSSGPTTVSGKHFADEEEEEDEERGMRDWAVQWANQKGMQKGTTSSLVGGLTMSMLLPPREPILKLSDEPPEPMALKILEEFKSRLETLTEQSYNERFQVVEVLGEGFNGKVTMMRDTQTNKVVCHKVAKNSRPGNIGALFHELLVSTYLDLTANQNLLVRARVTRLFTIKYGPNQRYCLESEMVHGHSLEKIQPVGMSGGKEVFVVVADFTHASHDSANLLHQLLCAAVSVRELCRCEVLHSDMHEGNLMFTERVSEGRLYYQNIVILDFGEAVLVRGALRLCTPAIKHILKLADADHEIMYATRFLNSLKNSNWQDDVISTRNLIVQWEPHVQGFSLKALTNMIDNMGMGRQQPIEILFVIVKALFTAFKEATGLKELSLKDLNLHEKMLSTNQTLLVSGPTSPPPTSDEGMKSWAQQWATRSEEEESNMAARLHNTLTSLRAMRISMSHRSAEFLTKKMTKDNNKRRMHAHDEDENVVNFVVSKSEQ